MLLYHDFFDIPVPELIKRVQEILFDIAVKCFFNFSKIWKCLTGVLECLAWRIMKSIHIVVHVVSKSSALSLWCTNGKEAVSFMLQNLCTLCMYSAQWKFYPIAWPRGFWSVCRLPDGCAKCFEKSFWDLITARGKLFGASKNDFWAST